MLQGKAYTCSNRHDGQDVHVTWTTQEILRWWQLPPAAIELLVLRIGWWQSIVEQPANRAQFLGVFFGRHRYEDEKQAEGECIADRTLTDGGVINTEGSS